MAHKIAIVLGSESDLPVVKDSVTLLDEFGLDYDMRIISAHRSPDEAHTFASTAEKEGYQLIIAVAGGAAHLAGVIASLTVLPVIGVPVRTRTAGGLDSLLSVVQMPSGVPVATMGIGEKGARNAVVLAAKILAVADPELRVKVRKYKTLLAQKVARQDLKLRQEGPQAFAKE